MKKGSSTAKGETTAAAHAARRTPARRTSAAALEGRLAEAEQQQAATSEILRVIQRSRADAQPVFETIASAALRLCAATDAVVFRFDGELLHIAALASANPDQVDALYRAFPRPPSRDTAAARAVLTKRMVVIPDVLLDSDYTIRGPALAAGFRSTVSVPLLRDGEPIGAIGVGRAEAAPFSDKQIALLQTFADQAVIAIENVRLFTELEMRNRELTEALEQQTATSEILRVISQSPRDVQPVFDTIAQATLKLCHATSAAVFTYDGELLRVGAVANLADGGDAVRGTFPRPVGRDNTVGRAVMTRNVVAITDVLEDPDYDYRLAVAGGFRATLAVPLLQRGSVVGGITVHRPEPGEFADTQVALLRTFADQAVIAIENVRLFTALEARNRELTEALAQQTATSDILRVISESRTDTQPVFDIIGERAEKLCNAEVSIVSIVDGDLIRLVALHGEDPEGTALVRRRFPMSMNAETVTARAARSRTVVHLEDLLADSTYETKEEAQRAGFRSGLGVPMLREGRVIGVIFVSRRTPGLFADSQIALLQTFADQAVIAIENVRLFTELQARTHELTRSVRELKALGEVGHAVSSTLDVETVLATIASRATALAGMDGGAIHEYDEARAAFRLRTTHGLPEDVTDALRAAPVPRGEGAIGRMAVSREPVGIGDITNPGSYQSRIRDRLLRHGYRAVLAVPLLHEDRLVGGLVVLRKSAGEFPAHVIDLLKTFATQSALAIQNARLYREIEQKSRELEVASRHKSEFLANMSHELRTPLNAIIGFSEVLAERMFGDLNAKQTEYVGDILESGRHLLSLINDILDLSKIEAGRMEVEPSDFDLPAAIEGTLVLVRERAARRGIALGHDVDARLGVVRADERKVKQVLLNLLSNALKFTPEGGRIDVRAALRDGTAEIAVADTGVGIAPDDQATVFEQFRQVGTAAKKVEGTGLGLAISRKFVELQGGRIWVESRPGAGATFTFTLPLQ